MHKRENIRGKMKWEIQFSATTCTTITFVFIFCSVNRWNNERKKSLEVFILTLLSNLNGTFAVASQ